MVFVTRVPGLPYYNYGEKCIILKPHNGPLADPETTSSYEHPNQLGPENGGEERPSWEEKRTEGRKQLYRRSVSGSIHLDDGKFLRVQCPEKVAFVCVANPEDMHAGYVSHHVDIHIIRLP